MESYLTFSLCLGALLSLAMTQPAPPSSYGLPPPPPMPFGGPFPPPPPPPATPEEADGFNMAQYSYDKAGRVAREIFRLVHPPPEEFLEGHVYFMMHSPTAKVISEYADKVEYAKSNGGESCLANGEEAAVKDFRKRLAEVVWTCESGWKRNSSITDKGQALLKTVNELDSKAAESLKDCKPGNYCYEQFKKSAQAASINKQLADIRTNQLIDLKVLSDQDHVTSVYNLYKCNADLSEPLRKDIFTSVAKLNVCIYSSGLITNF